MKNKKVLVLYAHPSQHRSEVNTPMIRAVKTMANVTVVDLYYEYPNFDIDIDLEQQRLLEHDVIVFQFPLYWYSTPSLLKEWQDLVLEYGFAYGQDGRALQGKLLLCALTAGGKEQTYRDKGYNHFTIRQMLYPIEQMACMTKMRYLPPFALFDARKAYQDQLVHQHVDTYRQLLQALIDDRLDIEQAAQLDKLTHHVEHLILPSEAL